jgi:hypothetical protein
MSTTTSTNYTKLDTDNIEIEMTTVETTQRTRADIHAESNAITEEQTAVDLVYTGRLAQLQAMITILDTP